MSITKVLRQTWQFLMADQDAEIHDVRVIALSCYRVHCNLFNEIMPNLYYY